MNEEYFVDRSVGMLDLYLFDMQHVSTLIQKRDITL